LSQKEVPLVLVGTAIPLLLLKGLGLRLGIGVAIGLLAGGLLSVLLKQAKTLPQELKEFGSTSGSMGRFQPRTSSEK